MLLLQFLRQIRPFVKVRWELHRAAQRVRDRRLARPTFQPVASHHPQLPSDHLGQRRVMCPRFLFGQLQISESK